MKGYLRDGTFNMRGIRVRAFVDGKWRKVKVITRIRPGRWLVQGRELPKAYERAEYQPVVRRVTVSEDDIAGLLP